MNAHQRRVARRAGRPERSKAFRYTRKPTPEEDARLDAFFRRVCRPMPLRVAVPELCDSGLLRVTLPPLSTSERDRLLRDALYGALGRDYEGPLVGLKCTGLTTREPT